MNNAINEIKNQETKNQEPLKRTKSRIMEAEDRISEVEDKMVAINEAGRKNEKRIKRNEDRDPTGGARWGRGGKRCTTLGRTRASLWLPELLRPGKTQHAGTTESALLWRTRKLEPHWIQGLLHTEQPGA